MANENAISFGWLSLEEMNRGIVERKLQPYTIVYTKDSHEQYLIDAEMKPVLIRSKVQLFSSEEAAIEELNNQGDAYAGQIVSILDGDTFRAYMVNQWSAGAYYVTPIYGNKSVDYNDLSNIPIINVESSVTNPVDLTTLSDGTYKINYFVSPSTGKVLSSIVGEFFVISRDVNTIYIKRIAFDKIYDYTITNDKTTVKKYITDSFLEENGYVNDSNLDKKLQALTYVNRTQLEDYVKNTVEMLIVHILNEQLDLRYGTEADINAMFGK